jgi:hypothetical protein
MITSKGLTILNKNQCARGSLNKLGIDKFSNGHWFHRFQYFFIRLIPSRLFKNNRFGKRKIELK